MHICGWQSQFYLNSPSSQLQSTGPSPGQIQMSFDVNRTRPHKNNPQKWGVLKGKEKRLWGDGYWKGEQQIADNWTTFKDIGKSTIVTGWIQSILKCVPLVISQKMNAELYSTPRQLLIHIAICKPMIHNWGTAFPKVWPFGFGVSLTNYLVKHFCFKLFVTTDRKSVV